MHNINKLVIKTSFILSIGLIVSALIVSFGIASRIPNYQRTVIVKGLSEREVDANLAVWPIKYAVGSANLSEVQNQILTKTKIISAFLKKHNLDENDFSIQRPSITDRTLDTYQEKNSVRYFGSHTIMVHTRKIKNISNALASFFEFILKEGFVSQERYSYGSGVKYYFTDLNTIKPDMISEATKNARIAAENFAKDSKSKVGKIKRAQQGVFSIEDVNTEVPERKTVRVIVTVEYFLTD